MKILVVDSDVSKIDFYRNVLKDIADGRDIFFRATNSDAIDFLTDEIIKPQQHLDLIITDYRNFAFEGEKTTIELIEWIRRNEANYSFNNFKFKSLPIIIYDNLPREDLGKLSINMQVDREADRSKKPINVASKEVVKEWRKQIFDDLEILGVGLDYDFSKVKSGYTVRAKSENTKILSYGFFLAQQALPYLWLNKEFFEIEKSIEELEHLVFQYLELSKETLKRNQWERQFQLFFERNPKFLFGNNFNNFWSEPIIKDYRGKRHKPDLVKEPILNETLGKNWEVIDLKTPITDFVEQGRFHPTFTAKFHKYLTQLRDYKTLFKDERNKTNIENVLKFHPKNPKFTLVVGKRDAYFQQQDLIHQRLDEENFSFINLITYDEIVESGKLELERVLQLRII